MNEKLELYTRTGRSRCHHAPWRLTLSRAGGLVSKNCSTCGFSRKVGLRQLPELICGDCQQTLQASVGADDNYWYVCDCGAEYRLADWVPAWNELFPYCGLGLLTDR
jgi:hypothetical protein